jgi:hypothetical protein
LGQNGLAAIPIDSLLESELERRLCGRLLRFNNEDLDFVVTARESERLELTVAGRKWQVTPQRYIDRTADSGALSPRLPHQTTWIQYLGG